MVEQKQSKMELIPLIYNGEGKLIDIDGNEVKGRPICRGPCLITIQGSLGQNYNSAFEIISGIKRYFTGKGVFESYPEDTFPNLDLEGKIGFVEGLGKLDPSEKSSETSILSLPVQLYKIL